MSAEAARLREKAVEAARLGRIAEAATLHDRAVERSANDASILNSAAFFFSKNGQAMKAVELLQRAVAVDPHASEPLFNLALILTSSGRAERACDLLTEAQARFGSQARYWSIRAGAERALGRKRDALSSYENAARLDPSNFRYAHGAARMALETGRPAAHLYTLLAKSRPDDREIALGLAQALEAEGQPAKARAFLETRLEAEPGWTEALELIAQWRWGSGERDLFTDHFAAAAAARPDAALYVSWCRTLGGVDRFAEAAEVAAAARRMIGDLPYLALLEARYRGEAGDDGAAEKIFAALPLETPERLLHEARHRLRMRDAGAAESLCARLIDEQPDNVSAWALRGIAWRLLDDHRSEWLHGQPGLIDTISLGLSDEELREAIAYLDGLHDRSAMPVGQSVRGGTQTRGGLFDRHEADVRKMEAAFRRAVDKFRSGLPPRDEGHPLLRHRDDPWRIAGSWSIRLINAGHHAQHIHPNGLISSAAYFAVPASASDPRDKAGWLELGRPPADLRIDLQPAAMIEPRVGECTLFPSTLYHGTRPFPAGKRMSVAIDINLERSA